MKVAVVSPYALDAPGGVQDQVLEISSRLGELGIESWVVGPGESGPDGSRLLGGTITIPANGSKAPISLNPRLLKTISAAVEGADVVHLHEPLMPVVGWAALQAIDVPMVGTFHAGPSRFVSGLYRRLHPLARRMVRGLTEVTAVSEVAAAPVRHFRSELTIVPNGLDTAVYRSESPHSPNRVVFLSRDEPRKGLDVLLAAWPAIRQAVPDAHLDVIGANRSDQIPGVEFRGTVVGAPKRELLSAASVFVAPHIGGESFGIALLEGMATGCAAVSSDITPFTAVGGDAPVYFPAGDSAALGRAVVGLLEDPQARERTAKACMERSQVFDWTTVLPAYVRMYEAALSGR